MRALRNVVATGRTIACTIHQPSTEIFVVGQLAPRSCAFMLQAAWVAGPLLCYAHLAAIGD